MVITLVGLLGVCLGSFVNALVWRLHEQARLKSTRPREFKKRLAQLSISRGRSVCPNCRHQLSAKDLVPVLSWLALRGKCRYCHRAISPQYPFVELLVAVLFIASYIYWPYQIDALSSIAAFSLWLCMLTGFVAHSVYDIRWYMLLDRLTWPLTVLGVLYVGLQAYAAQDAGVLAGAFVGGFVIFGLFFVLFQISDGAWIGGGDVKIAPLLGMLSGGFVPVMLLIFTASVLGTLYAVCVAVVRNKPLVLATKVPFGPFLLAATGIVVLFGSDIIDWYMHLVATP